MDTRDLLVLIVAVAVVVAIALVLRYPAVIPAPATTPSPTILPVTAEPRTTTPTPSTGEAQLPVRITYTTDYFSYPVHHMPENMQVFGASDPLWNPEEMATFAYLEERGGGVSRIFVVPYPRWQVIYTMDADLHPGSALLQWVLVDARTGEVVDGGELRTEPREVKRVQISGKEMYFILRVRDAEGVRLSLEAPGEMVAGTEETIRMS
ncbi:MAG: hypothetical protein RQ758_07760 [Methanomicrobiaceae archaeon]|nr:hypothetical protein [Methanomicrobiaceae archaeon]